MGRLLLLIDINLFSYYPSPSLPLLGRPLNLVLNIPKYFKGNFDLMDSIPGDGTLK